MSFDMDLNTAFVVSKLCDFSQFFFLFSYKEHTKMWGIIYIQ